MTTIAAISTSAPGALRPSLMGVHLLKELEQLCCRVPITDGHGLIGWRTDNFAETAFGALSTETLGIDHTITRPDVVDSLAGIKNRHSLGRINIHQKDCIAVIFLWL